MSVGIAITSYNRWFFLEKCLDSLFNLVGYNFPIVLVEDSCNQEIKSNIIKKYSNKLHFIFNEENQGQAKSIDIAYNWLNDNHKIKYILHIEDDYLFDSNPKFIDQAIDILESRKDVKNVWLRHHEDYKLSHGPTAINQLFEPTILTTYNQTQYLELTQNHYGNWCGFSWQTSIKRMSDYLAEFPNGYDSIAKQNGVVGVHAEHKCSEHANKFGMRAAQLMNGCCRNKGWNATTY